jgi:hypothetical protein
MRHLRDGEVAACTPKAEQMAEKLVVSSKRGTVNRLPPSRPAIDAKCGKCKAKVFVALPEDVDAENFDRQVSRSTVRILVDFWEPWCGPCRMCAGCAAICPLAWQCSVRHRKRTPQLPL